MGAVISPSSTDALLWILRADAVLKQGGFGFNAGVQNGWSPYPSNPYGNLASPKAFFTNRGTGN